MVSDNWTRRNGKLNLSHLTPEEMAKWVLNTPPERDETKQKRDGAS